MPELPEVETVRRQLAPRIVGRRFDHVEISDPRVVRPHEPLEVAAELTGERVRELDRRGKYLIVRFDSGRALLIHLRMTGTLLHGHAGAFDEDPYRRAVVRLDDGSDVAYRDIRRFGTWLLLEESEIDPYLAARLGQEPLERTFTPARLASALAGRRLPLKAALLDQRTLAGIGNIYADEALFKAGLHPLVPAGDVTDPAHLKALTRGIKAALRAGIARQGATVRDYAQPDGGRGRMQEAFKVYGRTGEPCDRCGTPIAKIRVSGRGTWFCPSCQARQAAASRPRDTRPPD